MTASVVASGVAFVHANGRKLFTNLNFKLETKLYSLVGPNGVGKTTLAKLIVGILEPSAGSIRRSTSALYFEQRVNPLGESIDAYLTRLGAYDEWSAFREKLLEGLDLEAPCSSLSGGQWMRVRLAALLSSPSAFLILDEPTNDLDREGRSAITDFLRTYEGGVLLISHDRELLELSESVLELSNQGLALYGLSWAEYLGEKDRERSRLGLTLETARRDRDAVTASRHEALERQEKRNRRGRADGASGSLPKILAGGRKRRAQITTGKVEASTLQRANVAVTEAYEAYQAQKIDPVMYAELEQIGVPSQKLVAEAIDFNAKYKTRTANAADADSTRREWLYRKDLNFAWRGPIRVAIRGANGSGKSTLLKLLFEQRRARLESTRTLELETRGLLKAGDLQTMILDQRCAQLDDDLSVLENVNASSRLGETEIRNSLARFLFTKDSVFQKVRDLSGGERLRAALAKGFLSGKFPELLILDEPTNNLDLRNIEFLENLLKSFSGALIVISHDEVFLENIGIETELRV